MSPVKQVEKLARKAVKCDDWMDCVVDETPNITDYGEFQNYHRTAWEETTHFQIKYCDKIRETIKIDIIFDSDAYWAEYYELIDAFWEEWERKAKLFKLWSKQQCLTKKAKK